MKNNIILGIVVAGILSGVFYCGVRYSESKYLATPPIVTVTHDTVEVVVPIVKWRNLPAVLSKPIVAPVSDSDYFDVQIASIDTVINRDTVHIDYIFPPINQFGFILNHAPVECVTDTVHITLPPVLRENTNWTLIEAGVLVGLISGYLITR